MFSSPPLLQRFGQAVALNSVLFVVAKAKQQRVLTAAGLLHGLFLGVLLWTCLWWQGYVLCLSLLVFGSIVTRIKRAEKEAAGIAEKRGGARGPENLWGAAGAAAICAVCALMVSLLAQAGGGKRLYEELYRVLLVGYTAALATKLSDTTASEIGKAYGSITYLVTTLQVVPKGTEGAVSAEGTVAGAAASVLAALYGLGVGLLRGWMDVGIVIVAAFVATTAESFIGASVQDRYKWSNELVNFLNTTIGAMVGIILGYCFVGV